MTVKKLAVLALTIVPAIASAQAVPAPEPEVLPLVMIGAVALFLARKSRKR